MSLKCALAAAAAAAAAATATAVATTLPPGLTFVGPFDAIEGPVPNNFDSPLLALALDGGATIASFSANSETWLLDSRPGANAPNGTGGAVAPGAPPPA
jgi:hypothetical protein